MKRLFMGAAGVLLFDSFTDTNGVNLTAHTPETGGPWIKYSSVDYTIQDNKAETSSNSIAGYAVDVGTPNIVMTCDIYRVLSGSSFGMYVRGVDIDNFIFCQLAFGASITQIQLYTVINGVFALLALEELPPISIGSFYKLNIEATIDKVTAFVDGEAQTAVYNGTVHNTGTEVALLSGSAALSKWDNVEVVKG